MNPDDDRRWMAHACALGWRARGHTGPNPNVGCVIVRDGRIVGRGWTQVGGRPHAEAMALDHADTQARGATAYVTLEPCAHASDRGPACSNLLINAGVARVVAAMIDPDPRTAGRGMAALGDAGIACMVGTGADAAHHAMAGWLMQMAANRPYVTLKLAMSLDGQIALADGESRWITGPRARAHAHLMRALSDAILVGRGTLDVDAPTLDVRLSGLEHRRPHRFVLTTGAAPDGWNRLSSPDAITNMDGINDLLIEGGAATAAAFLRADLVDRLILYHAPIVIGHGRAAIGDLGLDQLGAAHDRWTISDSRMLGKDRMDIYSRSRN